MPRSNQPCAAMIAIAAAGKMIALPKLANRSSVTRPSNTGPAWDGAPISATVAPSSRATASQLTSAEPRRPVKAATIIRIVPPTDRMSSGSEGGEAAPSVHRSHVHVRTRPCRASGANRPPARRGRAASAGGRRHCGSAAGSFRDRCPSRRPRARSARAATIRARRGPSSPPLRRRAPRRSRCASRDRACRPRPG